MGFVAAAGLALGVGSTIYKGIKGANQISAANAMHPTDPGFQINQDVINNALVLSDKYNNYVMPGYNNAKNDLDSAYAGAFAASTQGATSSTDVLDAANKLNFNESNALNKLNATQAQMKENLLPNVLQAQADAGNQYVLKSQYDNQRYQQQVNEKAALTQAGNTNLYGAIDGLASTGTAFLNYKSPSSTTAPAGGVTIDPSIFDSGMNVVNGYSKQRAKAAAAGIGNYYGTVADINNMA